MAERLGLFGLTISQGAIANVLACVGEAIAAPAERIAAEVRANEVVARLSVPNKPEAEEGGAAR